MDVKVWQDTVMSDEELATAVWGEWNSQHWRVAHAQAEITWSAREPEIEEARKAGQQEGRREVVEWVDSHKLFAGNISIPKNVWQAKLKEWGIKE